MDEIGGRNEILMGRNGGEIRAKLTCKQKLSWKKI
jgi:hypothetical protein